MNIECRVPDNQTEKFKIETFTVSNKSLNYHQWSKGNLILGRGSVPSGTYKRLIRLNSMNNLIMSNTPDEIKDHTEFINKAKGEVLINGLGLGIVIEMLLLKPEVTHITVIEKEEEIIKMVDPYFKDDRITIICDDAFNYNPPLNIKYGAVWHDIWDYICEDNLENMHNLRLKYENISEWQGCWCENECKKIYTYNRM
jgi:hypothetical protein